MRLVLDRLLKRAVVQGQLTLRWPDGTATRYGDGSGPPVCVVLHDAATVRRIGLNPNLAFGEAYMDGTLQPVGCTIYDVLDLLLTNLAHPEANPPILRLHDVVGWLLRRVAQFNPTERARRNVEHHYDLNGTLYNLFLDADRQYSCAYFEHPDMTLEAAQLAKKRHIAAKLLLDRPDLSVLDIGSGWGGMGLTLAREYGAQVTGITLSSEQLASSQERAEAEGLSDRVSFLLRDYRMMEGVFDRIVSVGMFEHVGVVHYDAFFQTVSRRLAPGGVALLHFIGRSHGPGSTNTWLTKYIFPGGYSPALSEVLPALERSGLVATDIEILQLHYAETLRHWRARFQANRDAIKALYDERFCRMFEFYLAGSELSFRRTGHVIFQIQITNDKSVVPPTRAYIYDGAHQDGAAMAATSPPPPAGAERREDANV